MQLMNTYKKKILWGMLLCSSCLVAPATLSAQQHDSAVEIIKLLKEKNIITAEEAYEVLLQHKTNSAVVSPAPAESYVVQKAPVANQAAPMQTVGKPVTVVVPKGQRYLQTITDEVARDIKEEVKQQVKLELKDEIAKEVKLEAYTGSVPAWTKRIRFGGDFRLRYQGDNFDENNISVGDPSNPSEILNRTEDRNRLRYRARVSAKAQINNQTEVGLRLATGNEGDPVSTNDTLGDYQNKDSVTFDQAYLKWTPVSETSTWTGKLDFIGGRLPNPFISTDLVWDDDVNFEGLATNLEYPINSRLKALFNAGVFPLEEIELSSQDKWFYGGQVGMEYVPRTNLSFTLAAAYYDYRNIQGKPNDPNLVFDGVGPNDHTLPAFLQGGNGLFNINEFTSGDQKYALASDYDELNVTAKMDIGFFDPIYISLLVDYVKNIGFDPDEIKELTGFTNIPQEDTGYQVGITVGYPKIQKLWDWNTSLFYKYLEGDAVLDAFTDSDFHLGGTNAKGWTLTGQLGIADNLWLKARWLTSDEIRDVPFAVDTLQIDINSRF